MIKRFWYCARGIDHVRTNDPCQDAYLSVRHGNNMVFGIGDGPGSRPHSERGSRRAVASAVLYTANHLSDDLAPRDVEEVLRRAFLVSYHEVCELARQAGEDVSELDTTLCLGVWDGNRLSFGQAGDSGMVAALADGTYVAVTRQQRTADGYLIPLRFGPDTWEFGTVEADVAAVLVATDGLLERVCPRLLADTDKPVYVPLAQILMHHTEKDVEELRTARHAWRAFVREDPRMHTTDDATMLVFFDPEHPPALRDESYYEEPDWETLRGSCGSVSCGGGWAKRWLRQRGTSRMQRVRRVHCRTTPVRRWRTSRAWCHGGESERRPVRSHVCAPLRAGCREDSAEAR